MEIFHRLFMEPSPAVGADGTVYVGAADGNLYAITPAGTLKWKFQAKELSWFSSPAIGANGTIFIGASDFNLYAIGRDLGPLCDIQLTKTNYVIGETVTAQVLRIANTGTTAVEIEFKFWFDVPTIPPVSFARGGANGEVVLPAGFDQNFGPLTLFTVQPAFPRGTYAFSCLFLDPVTGKLLAEDLNPFTIQ